MLCEKCREPLYESTSWVVYQDVRIAEIDFTICKKCGIVDIPRQEYDFDSTDERFV